MNKTLRGKPKLFVRASQSVNGVSFPCDHMEASVVPCCDALRRCARFTSRDGVASPRWVDRAGWSMFTSPGEDSGHWVILTFCPFCGTRIDPKRSPQSLLSQDERAAYCRRLGRSYGLTVADWHKAFGPSPKLRTRARG